MYKDECTKLFTAAFFVITKDQNQPKHLTLEEHEVGVEWTSITVNDRTLI